MRTLVSFILVSFWILSAPAQAQTDATPARSTVVVLNWNYDTNVIGADSVAALTLPARTVIERVIWSIDTVLTGIDSLQLRAGESQAVIATCLGTDDGATYGVIQLAEPARAIIKAETLRVIQYGTEGLSGQVRVFIIWRELN